MPERSTKVLIVGDGTGAVAAALACAARGVPCIIAGEHSVLGGQLTTQGVPPDENQWVETDAKGFAAATRTYSDLRRRVRAWYKAQPNIVANRQSDPHLNPGGGWVSRLCAAPSVFATALNEMLQPHIGTGLITHLSGLRPVKAELSSDNIDAVTFEGSERTQTVVRAQYMLDATELGDLLDLAGVEHALGAEHQRVHGEHHARTDFNPSTNPCDRLDQQAFSWCFALEHCPGEDCTVPRPQTYNWWRDHVPAMNPRWCGPLFSWTVPSHNDEGHRTFRFVPWPDSPHPGEWEMWRYRRIGDQSLFDPPSPHHPDVAFINMVQIDYWQRPLIGGTPADRAAALAGAREQSLCFLHWMQTEAPRHDSDTARGYPGLRLRAPELCSPDGFALAPYIREARRLSALTVVHEGHVGTAQRRLEGRNTKALAWDATPFGTAEPFADSVGIGHYMIDLHPSCAGRNSVYVPAAPFRIPLGALIPIRVRNLFAAGKCLGVTHITNGAYRMHPIEWNIGESAGHTAATCVLENTQPHAIHASAARTADLQRVLAHHGIPLRWPWES